MLKGDVKCPLVFCDQPGICSGRFLHNQETETKKLCEVRSLKCNFSIVNCLLVQDACNSYPGCRYYSYSPSSTGCVLFATCPELEDFEDVTTSQPGCLLNNDGR